jgi:hypothetical protein
MPRVQAWMAKKTSKTNCTLDNAAIRREWYVLDPLAGKILAMSISVAHAKTGATFRFRRGRSTLRLFSACNRNLQSLLETRSLGH